MSHLLRAPLPLLAGITPVALRTPQAMVTGLQLQILQWRARVGRNEKLKMTQKFTQPSIVSISGSLIKLKLSSK